MDHERAREMLPWLLNGTLDEPERKELLAALAASPELRAELAETRLAGEVFGQHVAAADLVAFAGGEPTGLERGRIEAHLALCERCAEELAMARESRDALAAEEGTAAAPAAPAREERRGRLLPFLRPAAGAGGAGARRQLAALAAGLVALIGLAGWFWLWQSPARVADPIAAVEGSLPPAAGPAVGTAGLLADVLRSSGTGEGPNRLRLESRSGHAVLYAPGVERDSEVLYELRLAHRGSGAEPLRLRPVAPTPGSPLEFRPPAELLAEGEHDAELMRFGERGWEPVERYVLTVAYPEG